MEKQYYVYIVSNINQSVFYVGTTNDLKRRISEHRAKLIPGFTEKYNICKLLFFEIYSDPISAITREKQIKKYRREKKLNLIFKQNPNMQDLFDRIILEI